MTKRTGNGVEQGRMVFRPRARILRLLGEELISDEIIAVSELVKNAHDADGGGASSASPPSPAPTGKSASRTTAVA